MNLTYLSPIANHLWQSTLFGAFAGLLILALRSNRARVRYWIWFAASCKFLIPLSVLIALGGKIAPPVSSQTTHPNLSFVMDQASQPFTVPAASSAGRRASATPIAPDPLPTILVALWACGFIGIAGSWWIRWRRVRAEVRAGSPLQLAIPIGVVSSHSSLEPGVFGVFKPVLLLPDGIFRSLTPAQFEAVIAHELCHVRHRDNLIAAMHMFVETAFWFHPLVWWLGKRMVDERERACDEEVLHFGSEARVYAEGILNVSKLFVESPVVCVSGVTGSNLKKRIEAIMSGRKAVPITLAKKVVLSAAGIAALAVPIAIGIGHAPQLRAQSPTTAASSSAGAPHFEVASIRTCIVEPNTGTQRRREYTVTPGRVEIECLPLERIIFFAYAGIGNLDHMLLNDSPQDPGHVHGGPGWVRSEKFTIEATAEGTPDRRVMMGPMLRALLEDRFQLKTHRETEEVPMYALTVAKGGLKIKPLAEGGCTSFETAKDLSREAVGALNNGPHPVCGSFRSLGDGVNANWTLGGESMTRFANGVLSTVLDRYVIDQTGIPGIFNIHLEFALDDSIKAGVFGGGRAQDPPPPGIEKQPSIFTALEEQLGLKIEKTKGPHEFLVIDHVEKPSGN